MKYVAALYAENQIFTGNNHGEAFEKMSAQQQNGQLTSGFLDLELGKFISDDCTFYLKQLLLLRHSDVEDGPDPELTSQGRRRTSQAAEYLQAEFDLSEYRLFSSTKRRCQQTADIISQELQLELVSDDNLQEQFATEDVNQFSQRLKQVLDRLPTKSLIVSHCDCIMGLVQMATGTTLANCPQWNGVVPRCSVTYVDGNKAVWIGHEITDRD